MAGTAAHAFVVFHHGFDRQNLKQQLAGMGFSQMKNTATVTFHTPFEGQDDQEFSVFLITGRT
ncbi:MAG: hypothetical protein ACYC4N_12565 [Pirellulaceae bacterium]